MSCSIILLPTRMVTLVSPCHFNNLRGNRTALPLDQSQFVTNSWKRTGARAKWGYCPGLLSPPSRPSHRPLSGRGPNFRLAGAVLAPAPDQPETL